MEFKFSNINTSYIIIDGRGKFKAVKFSSKFRASILTELYKIRWNTISYVAEFPVLHLLRRTWEWVPFNKIIFLNANRIAVDVAEGLKFMNDHGIAYRDLNANRILLDRQGNACVSDMGIVTVCKNNREVMEYETDGYRWLAPEIIAGDPESVTETWMSNVYSYGMVLWEMVTREATYSAYSPVQAAVGIAACGLRPEIPKDCPQVLRSLMTKCWNNCPSKRPQFSKILAILLRSNNSTR